MMMRLRRILLWLFFSTTCFAQTVFPSDTAKLPVRQFKTSLNELKKEKKYTYEEIIQTNDTSVLAQLWLRFKQWLNDFLSQESNEIITDILVYAFLGTMILLVILQLMGIDLVGLLLKRGKQAAVDFMPQNETIYGRNFDEEINAAILKGEFQLGVRLLYLKTLKELSDKELINWTPNRTNRSYVEELSDKWRKDFGALTNHFEYAWYGGVPIPFAEFELIKADFEHFKEKL